jgi:D-lactate dehydrogenase
MQVAVYSTHKFEKTFLEEHCKNHDLRFIETRLTEETTGLAKGAQAICIFVNDDASAPVLEKLRHLEVKYLALRSAGFNHVDVKFANEVGMRVARVPDYSPAAIAEHTVALMLVLNRKLIRAHSRIRDLNFSLDGLTGFDMAGKTVGILGTGKIGSVVARILHGFNCNILAYDPYENEELKTKYNVTYTDYMDLCKRSHIITLHLPLTPESKNIIGKESIDVMRPGVMLINTSRGALVDTREVIKALKSGKIGSFGIDVYEEESGLFFEDHSDQILQDDVIARLMTFQNVMITSHQAFLTQEALGNIAETTASNLDCWERGNTSKNEISA